MEKPKRGRPAKATETKQMNVRVSKDVLAKLEASGKLKFMSFSQYVNSLIDQNLK